MLTTVATSEFVAIVPLITPPNPDLVSTSQELSPNLVAVTSVPSDEDQALECLS